MKLKVYKCKWNKKHIFIGPTLKTLLKTVEGTSLENQLKMRVGCQGWDICYYRHGAKMCLNLCYVVLKEEFLL